MITESSTTAAPAEIYENIEKVHQQVETIQRELSQAMEVWNTTLAGKKNNLRRCSRAKNSRRKSRTVNGPLKVRRMKSASPR